MDAINRSPYTGFQSSSSSSPSSNSFLISSSSSASSSGSRSSLEKSNLNTLTFHRVTKTLDLTKYLFSFQKLDDGFNFAVTSKHSDLWKAFINHHFEYLSKHLWKSLEGRPVDPAFYAMLCKTLQQQHRIPHSKIWKMVQLNEFRYGSPLGVTSIAIDPEGQFVVTVSTNGAVRVWQPSYQDRTATVLNRDSPVLTVAVAPEGEFIVSGDHDGKVRVWYPTIADGMQAIVLEGHTGPVSSVAISPKSKFIVSGSQDHTVRVWSRKGYRSWQPKILKGHKPNQVFVSIDPQGKLILSADKDTYGDGTIWSRNESGNWTVRRDLIENFPIAMSKNQFIVWSRSKVRVLKRDDFGLVPNIADELNHPDRVTAAVTHPEGHFIATGCYYEKARIWYPKSSGGWIATPLKDDRPGDRASVRSIAINRSGHLIIAGCSDKTVRVWNQNGSKEWTQTPAVLKHSTEEILLPAQDCYTQPEPIVLIDSEGTLIASMASDASACIFRLNSNGLIKQATNDLLDKIPRRIPEQLVEKMIHLIRREKASTHRDDPSAIDSYDYIPFSSYSYDRLREKEVPYEPVSFELDGSNNGIIWRVDHTYKLPTELLVKIMEFVGQNPLQRNPGKNDPQAIAALSRVHRRFWHAQHHKLFYMWKKFVLGDFAHMTAKKDFQKTVKKRIQPAVPSEEWKNTSDLVWRRLYKFRHSPDFWRKRTILNVPKKFPNKLPDGQLVLGSNRWIWEPFSSKENPFIHTTDIDSFTACVTLEDGRVALARRNNNLVTISNPALMNPTTLEKEVISLKGHTDEVISILGLSGNRLASGSLDHTVRIWSLASPQEEPIILKHPNQVTCLIALSDGRLASLVKKSSMHIWDLTVPESPPLILDEGGNRDIYLVSLPKSRIASRSKYGDLRIWHPDNRDTPIILKRNTDTRNTYSRFRQADDKATNLICLVGGRIASAYGDGAVCIWNPDAPDEKPITFEGEGQVTRLIPLPNGGVAWISYYRQISTVRIWDPIQKNPTVLQSPGEAGRPKRRATDLFSLSDGRIACEFDDSLIMVFGISPERLIRQAIEENPIRV